MIFSHLCTVVVYLHRKREQEQRFPGAKEFSGYYVVLVVSEYAEKRLAFFYALQSLIEKHHLNADSEKQHRKALLHNMFGQADSDF